MQYYKSKKLNEITKEIVSLMPPLRSFFKSDDNITDYSKKLFTYEAVPRYTERQNKFIKILKSKVDRLFNSQEKKYINIFLDKNLGLKSGVVDHHGILNHPVLCGVNIVPHYFRMFNREDNGDILTFATGNVPLNDPFHRRGFLLNDIKINLFKKADKNKMVYNFPKSDFAYVDSLKKTNQWKFHSENSQKFLIKMQELINSIDFSTCTTLGDQFTKINFYLWKLLFDKNLRKDVSNLISVEYDDAVIDFLIHTIKNDPSSFVVKMLFEDNFREKTIAYFEGETGAWDKKRNLGTVFFWGISLNNIRLRMGIENGYLISDDKQLKIKLDQDLIISALQEKKILPGMFLKFSLILFYMGIKPFAGYGSANYLYNTQQKMIKFLNNDFPGEAKDIKTIITNNITSIPVLIKRKENKEIVSYFAFDIIKDGGLSKQYFEKLNAVPIKYFMASSLHTIYDYAFNLYGKGEKKDFRVISNDFESLYKNII